jgi:hypothetical protein
MTAKREIGRNDQQTGGNFRPGILTAWIRPVIISCILIVLAVFLLNLIIKGSFAQYANCNYLVVTRLEMDPFFCDGYDVKFFDATVFTIPGMKSVMDPPLELVRSAVVWSVILLLAFTSLFLTILIVNWKSILRLVTFHKEEWKRFMAGTRIWLFLFVVFCSIFYFAVGR